MVSFEEHTRKRIKIYEKIRDIFPEHHLGIENFDYLLNALGYSDMLTKIKSSFEKLFEEEIDWTMLDELIRIIETIISKENPIDYDELVSFESFVLYKIKIKKLFMSLIGMEYDDAFIQNFKIAVLNCEVTKHNYYSILESLNKNIDEGSDDA